MDLLDGLGHHDPMVTDQESSLSALDEVRSAAWRALGQAVRERRDELGLSIQSACAASGRHPGLNTWRRLESGASHRVLDDTLIAVEIALGWERGSCEAILQGEEPTLVDETDVIGSPKTRATILRDPHLDHHGRAMVLAMYETAVIQCAAPAHGRLVSAG